MVHRGCGLHRATCMSMSVGLPVMNLLNSRAASSVSKGGSLPAHGSSEPLGAAGRRRLASSCWRFPRRRDAPMALVALIAWLCTVSIGLYLLAIWLIEYDREFQSAAATRLPVPVIGTHALLAFGGLAVWALYLITDVARLAWVAAAALGVVIHGIFAGATIVLVLLTAFGAGRS